MSSIRRTIFRKILVLNIPYCGQREKLMDKFTNGRRKRRTEHNLAKNKKRYISLFQMSY